MVGQLSQRSFHPSLSRSSSLLLGLQSSQLFGLRLSGFLLFLKHTDLHLILSGGQTEEKNFFGVHRTHS